MSDTEDKNDGNENVISLDGFKKNQNEAKETKKFPTSVPTTARRYLIDLLDNDSIEIVGHIGLTGSFLAIGDEEGRIVFAVAQGQWTFVTDITDTGKTLEDFIKD